MHTDKVKVFIPGYINGGFWESIPAVTTEFESAVVFCEPEFEFVSDAHQADIIAINLIAQNPANIEGCSDAVFTMFKKYGPDKIYLDTSHCFHVGEGHSSPLNQKENVNIVLRILDRLQPENRPGFISIATNRFLHHRTRGQYLSHHIQDNIQYADFLWMRQVCFFNDQPDKIFKHPCTVRNHWYQPLRDGETEIDKNLYSLMNLDDMCNWEKIKCHGENDGYFRLYLSPNKYRGAPALKSFNTGHYQESMRTDRQFPTTAPAIRDQVRAELGELLSHWPGFLGDSGFNSFLVGQSSENLSDHLSGKNAGFLPIHNAYYDNSVISIYTETLILGDLDRSSVEKNMLQQVTGPTEKTFNPLIKGHFILPFGHHGLVRLLREEYNFRFPTFINYEYDEEINDLIRWFKFKAEVTRVLNSQPTQLYQQKVLNKSILEHNREQFMHGPQAYKRYDTSIANAIVTYNDTNPTSAYFNKIKRLLG